MMFMTVDKAINGFKQAPANLKTAANRAAARAKAATDTIKLAQDTANTITAQQRKIADAADDEIARANKLISNINKMLGE